MAAKTNDTGGRPRRRTPKRREPPAPTAGGGPEPAAELAKASAPAEAAAPLAFAQRAADALQGAFPLAGKEVLELGADRALLAARRFIAHGASRVLAASRRPIDATGADCAVEVRLGDPLEVLEAMAPASIDAVFGVNILGRLRDLPLVLEAIHRTLRPGGVAWLHGHPIWSSARGHELHLAHGGRVFAFRDPDCPIPPWGHLFLSERALVQHIVDAGHPRTLAHACADFVFRSERPSRAPRRRILKLLRAGQLALERLDEARDAAPAGAVLARLEASRAWDPDEDWSVRGLTARLRKAG